MQMQELKFRIRNYENTEEKLRKLGAEFLKELHVTDIYFKQPEGKVLKITIDNSGMFLVELEATAGKFQIKAYAPLTKVEATLERLVRKYGVKCIIFKRRRFWKLGEYRININIIPGVGDFLIFESSNIQPADVEKLKIGLLEIIKVSFDVLKCR